MNPWIWTGLAVMWVAGIAAYGTILGLLMAGVDRVLVARMQGRIGPPLTQPFYDVTKLLKKQDCMPSGATAAMRTCWVTATGTVPSHAGRRPM